MKRIWIIAAVAAGMAAGFGSCGSKQSEISISGAFALYPLAVKWAEEFQKQHPEVRIDISAGGAGKGMTDALSGMVDIGMVSREIYPVEAAKGAVAFTVAKDAVVATVNVDNPDLHDLLKTGLTREAAIKLWITGEYKEWGQVSGSGNHSKVHVYTRSDACGAAETWAAWLDSKQEDLTGTGVFGDPGVATAVQKDVLGIGLNNIGYVYDETTRKPNPGLKALPIDVDGNGRLDEGELFYDTKDQIIRAITENRYPSPPARNLYMITGGMPKKPEVIAFLRYILTEGQQHNTTVGYIGLPAEKLQESLRLLPDSIAPAATQPQ
ncbi:MAG: substrate-binding domain-containing protein [Bacteroidales bacterium]|jgi:phosphate transport system substrate-binding protein|nr:substrate-binding domain-containing protein [Bacteroidales bacterium]